MIDETRKNISSTSELVKSSLRFLSNSSDQEIESSMLREPTDALLNEKKVRFLKLLTIKINCFLAAIRIPYFPTYLYTSKNPFISA